MKSIRYILFISIGCVSMVKQVFANGNTTIFSAIKFESEPAPAPEASDSKSAAESQGDGEP